MVDVAIHEGDLPCVSRVERAYPALSGTARRVAEYILQHPSEAVGLSITELGRLSDVSETTVLRFVRRLGYSGYRQFALALASSQPKREHPLPEAALQVDIADDDEPEAIAQKVFAAEAQALSTAWQTIEPREWRRAIDVLSRARRVLCLAVGGSGLLAMEAVYRLVRLGLDCYAIYDPIQIGIQAGRLGPDGVAIGFSQMGRTRDTVEGLRLARASGATAIGVTSSPRSPITAVSDISLVLLELHTAYRAAYLDSKIAELTLIDALATCVARQVAAPLPGAVEQLNANIERMFVRSGRRHNTP
jgi:RpiR family transcriptional regulator, carbohydrate utilization regulator